MDQKEGKQGPLLVGAEVERLPVVVSLNGPSSRYFKIALLRSNLTSKLRFLDSYRISGMPSATT